MLSSDLKQGRSYKFDVIKEQSGRKYFKIATDDGIEFSLLKFKFQRNQPIPDQIDCYVKSLYPLTLGQDISIFINDFYKVGNNYDFKVKSIKSDSSTVYELEDDHDLCFKLYNAPDSLGVGSRIKCKIQKISGVNVNLKYVGTLATRLPLDFYDFSFWLSAIGIASHHEHYLHLLESLPEFKATLLKYDNDEADWIVDLIQTVANHITDWLIQFKDNRRMLANTVRRMRLASKTALLILEGSDFLRNCNADQRAMLQAKMSDCVELFDQYEQAATRIFDKTDEEFIDQMFSRLKKAGYLYKPSKQFRIMMTILKLRPELINSRMGELFEALHNWELSNWQSEPFRGALVEQLQIFIKENCGQVNLLPANDSGDGNKTVTRMILAIAVQSILANDDDKIDLPINRAMLYRYISYLYPKSVHTLLDKGADAILGLDRQAEYVWNDTEHPTLLMIKSLHPAPASEERDNLVKTYSTSKASVHLRPGSIQVVAKDAEPDSTVIPNGLFDWMNPQVSLLDDVKVHSTRRTKDLNNYRQMWEDIAWSIFGDDQSAGEKIEKHFPYGGEEVKVIIDDVRILNNVHEKQALQFHCTITDDLYYGDGWLICDYYHMIRWLTAKDIPTNYDGTLRFAQSPSGTPLLFPATVFRKNDELQFSMKSQIENYLVDSTWPTQESVCIVTHFDRANNQWLCLSELGCTFKVAFDESTEGLSVGKLVRVRYIERDRTGSGSEFFIGELSEDQDNLPMSQQKAKCLINLMQGLGEEQESEIDKNSEVMETEEVMTHEELLELTYMFQRCAYSEQEYIKAFNYLGFASILSRLADDQALTQEISTHMELLQLLQDFGKNQKVNMEWLSELTDKVKSTPMLERLHTRLRIVANLDLNENSDWLWSVRQNPRNEFEQHLASLVLSYNMMPIDMEAPRKEVLKQIATLLNVNSTTPTSKYYGDESQTVEFKSSLIYSTHGGGRPDVKDQMFEIVHIICGFMNARGGTLYIGVNDAGYENGLYDDMAYRRAHGKKDSIDAMIVELQNHLDRVMPSHAKDHWEIQSDPDSKKGVIMVKVLPVEQPVEYDGVIYVRSSSTTKPRLDDQREEFIRNRSHNYRLLMKIWGVGNEEAQEEEETSQPVKESVVKPAAEKTAPVEEKTETATVEDGEADEPDASNTLSTGKHRRNVLHSYEDGFVSPDFYLYFLDNGCVRYTREDSYLDYEPECRLGMAVTSSEKDGWLVLGYSDGTVVRRSMSEFADCSPNESRRHFNGANLEFANIASDDDYLLSVVKASYGGIFYRLDSISNLPEADSLTDQGQTLCSNQHTILSQEIVSPDKLAFFDADAKDRESRYYGIQLPQYDGTLTKQERIEALLRPIAARTE